MPVLTVPTWSKYNTGAYVGTVALAYLCFVMFMLFCFALVVFQGAVTEELGMGECLSLCTVLDVASTGISGCKVCTCWLGTQHCVVPAAAGSAVGSKCK